MERFALVVLAITGAPHTMSTRNGTRNEKSAMMRYSQIGTGLKALAPRYEKREDEIGRSGTPLNERGDGRRSRGHGRSR
jgi:hypothetical protein